jgi:hypothetical protein
MALIALLLLLCQPSMAVTRLRDPNVISLEEAAVLRGVSVKTAYRLARAGRFPGLLPREKGEHYKVSRPRFMREVHGTAEVAS